MDEESETSSPLRGRGRPSKWISAAEFKRIRQSPEWLAATSIINAAEYLMMFGDFRGPVELLEHEGVLVGPPKPGSTRR